MDCYILQNKIPVKVDMERWGYWFQSANRVVKKTEVAKDVEVSTVFLGMDHSFGSSNKPILFETMIFGGKKDGYQERYATWDEAYSGHDRIVNEFFRRCDHCGTLRISDEVKCLSCGGNI